MIEMYDMGRCTHKPAKGMYQFIVDNAGKYVGDSGLAQELREHAKNRELPGYSIPQEFFTEMCSIWVDAFKSGDFPIDLPGLVFPDTAPRFRKVKQAGRDVAIMTSGSMELVKLFYSSQLEDGRKLSDLIDSYFLGEEVGDKDFPETFAGLWEKTEGGIYAVFDDKLSVCRAASGGLKMAGGSAQIYLVDRKGKHAGDVLEEMAEMGVQRIASFDEAA